MELDFETESHGAIRLCFFLALLAINPPIAERGVLFGLCLQLSTLAMRTLLWAAGNLLAMVAAQSRMDCVQYSPPGHLSQYSCHLDEGVLSMS